MSMKITISIDEELCRKSKEYAKLTGRTLSGLIQICLTDVLKQNKIGDDKLGWKEEG